MGNMNEPDCRCEHVVKLFEDMNAVRVDICKLQGPKTLLIKPRAQRSSDVRRSGVLDGG